MKKDRLAPAATAATSPSADWPAWLLSAGSTPGAALRRMSNVRRVHSRQHPGERIHQRAHRQQPRPMYGHGFATLFLAECYGMTLRARHPRKAGQGGQFDRQHQNNEGGWRYHPQRRDADISVTICQIMALRAARNAGLPSPAKRSTAAPSTSSAAKMPTAVSCTCCRGRRTKRLSTLRRRRRRALQCRHLRRSGNQEGARLS